MRTSAGKRGIDRDAASSLVNIKAARPDAPVGLLKAVDRGSTLTAKRCEDCWTSTGGPSMSVDEGPGASDSPTPGEHVLAMRAGVDAAEGHGSITGVSRAGQTVDSANE